MRVKLAITGIAVLALAGCGGGGVLVAIHTAPPLHFPSSQAQSLTAEQIAKRMDLSGITAYNVQTDPNGLLGRQGEYTSKVNWGANLDNGIEVFSDVADAQTRLDYLKAFKPPFGDGYDHLSSNALLRLSADLTPSQASSIQAQFDKALGR